MCVSFSLSYQYLGHGFFRRIKDVSKEDYPTEQLLCHATTIPLTIALWLLHSLPFFFSLSPNPHGSHVLRALLERNQLCDLLLRPWEIERFIAADPSQGLLVYQSWRSEWTL